MEQFAGPTRRATLRLRTAPSAALPVAGAGKKGRFAWQTVAPLASKTLIVLVPVIDHGPATSGSVTSPLPAEDTWLFQESVTPPATALP